MSKPFNLADAIVGKPIETRDKRKAKFIAHVAEAKEYSRLIIFIDNDIYTYNENGIFSFSGNYRDFDLFMSSERKEGWVNVYKPISQNSLAFTNNIFITDVIAKENIMTDFDYITTTKIELEE